MTTSRTTSSERPAPLARASFEVVPTGWTSGPWATFEPFLIDVPALAGDDPSRAARRAWWSAFHLLGANGVEPEQFEVFEYDAASGRGRLATSGGFVPEPVGSDAA